MIRNLNTVSAPSKGNTDADMIGGQKGIPARSESRVVIEAASLTVGYQSSARRSVEVLSNIDATLSTGQFVFLLGPNGAGKSTLLRTLVGSQKPLSGRVALDGDDLVRLSARERAQRLSVVLTDRVDVGLMTVRALVGLGRAPRVGWFSSMSDGDHSIVEWALRAAGASDLAARQVLELSDGERQRVMIARALAQQPSILVLDEPTAFLDLTRRVELTALLRRLVDETGLAVLMSTHDLDLALRTADQIWLVHRDAKFQTGSPEDLALNGDIAAAYAGEGIAFDHMTGTFVVPAGSAGPKVAIIGEAIATVWARRAAERAGWVPEAAEGNSKTGWKLSVEYMPRQSVRWRLQGVTENSASGIGYAELVDCLRSMAVVPASDRGESSALEREMEREYVS